MWTPAPRPPSRRSRGASLARNKQRYTSEDQELERWRHSLDRALRPRRAGRRVLRGLASGLVVLGLTGSAGAVYFYRDINNSLDRVDVKLTEPAPETGTMNILLIGSDAREDLTREEKRMFGGDVSGQRADTIILAQLIPSEKRGVLLHFPRDLYVPIPGKRRQAKINSAYEAGPQAVIETVQRLTRVRINHFMEIDIKGFRRMVDAMGGIDICLDQKLYDPKLQFRLRAGPNHLDGNAALSFVRARYATGSGDFGRIQRQQQFLKAVVAKVGRPQILGRPDRVRALGRAFAQNVTVDQGFSLN
ncbi:MAG TPA: LCP family protein, partial [Actinomycetota bacterium]|nr:LCP family protein [Actinomycetota bacterium]